MMIGAELPYGARFIFWRRQPVFPESLSTTTLLTWIRSFGGAQPAAAPIGARSELKSISGKEKPRTIAATVLVVPGSRARRVACLSASSWGMRAGVRRRSPPKPPSP